MGIGIFRHTQLGKKDNGKGCIGDDVREKRQVHRRIRGNARAKLTQTVDETSKKSQAIRIVRIRENHQP